MQFGFLPFTNIGRNSLRHLHEGAHFMDIRDAEQYRTASAANPASSIDESADIRVAFGHHTVERRRDTLEAFERLQPVDLALCDIHICDGGI